MAKTKTIIGGVVGGLALSALCLVVLLLMRKKFRRRVHTLRAKPGLTSGARSKSKTLSDFLIDPCPAPDPAIIRQGLTEMAPFQRPDVYLRSAPPPPYVPSPGPAAAFHASTAGVVDRSLSDRRRRIVRSQSSRASRSESEALSAFASSGVFSESVSLYTSEKSSSHRQALDLALSSNRRLDTVHNDALYEFANAHRDLISPELERRLREAGYEPYIDPDFIDEEEWAKAGVGVDSLGILRGLYREYVFRKCFLWEWFLR
jgi:hypothetical protein